MFTLAGGAVLGPGPGGPYSAGPDGARCLPGPGGASAGPDMAAAKARVQVTWAGAGPAPLTFAIGQRTMGARDDRRGEIDLMRERRQQEDGPAARKPCTLRDMPLYMSLYVACKLRAGRDSQCDRKRRSARSK